MRGLGVGGGVRPDPDAGWNSFEGVETCLGGVGGGGGVRRGKVSAERAWLRCVEGVRYPPMLNDKRLDWRVVGHGKTATMDSVSILCISSVLLGSSATIYG